MNKAKQANNDIREALKNNNVAQWELAEKAGYTPSYLSVKMRHEFSGEEKFDLFCMIQQIVEERGDTDA